MYLWAPKGRLLCQVAQKCLCQESFTYARHTVTTLSHNRRLFPNSLLVYSSKPSTVYGAPVSRTPVLYGRLTAMSEEMQTFSTSSGDPETPKLSNRAKLKRAVKDYGATVIIFHVTISLMSLGISYLAISRFTLHHGAMYTPYPDHLCLTISFFHLPSSLTRIQERLSTTAAARVPNKIRVVPIASTLQVLHFLPFLLRIKKEDSPGISVEPFRSFSLIFCHGFTRRWYIGRLLCQVAQKCLCQESFTYARHTVTTLSHNRRLFPNSLLVYSSKPSTVYGAPVSRTPVLYGRLTAMSEEMQTFSTSSGDPETPKLSNRAKLKRAVKDYGATVIIFHVTISLMSLGISYLAISR
ncbi:hypothetical protein J6590_059568 [Homalodisca vitripennis]|nr:hypothetical protein J6590_059568 [Homalodisca vitripennis]